MATPRNISLRAMGDWAPANRNPFWKFRFHWQEFPDQKKKNLICQTKKIKEWFVSKMQFVPRDDARIPDKKISLVKKMPFIPYGWCWIPDENGQLQTI